MIAVAVICFILVLVRVAFFVAMAPLIGGTNLPRMVKAGLAMALTAFWCAAFWERLPVKDWMLQAGLVHWLNLGIALGLEAILGGALGCLFGLFLMPARIAGDYLSQEMGLSFGNLVGLTGQSNSSVLSIILEMIATMIFFSVDGHHVFLGVMHGTFEIYPVGGALPDIGTSKLIAGATAVEEWGLLLAAPVAACLFLTTIVLSLLVRVAPQFNLYTVGFPVRMTVGLAALVVFLPGMVTTLLSIFAHCGALVTGGG